MIWIKICFLACLIVLCCANESKNQTNNVSNMADEAIDAFETAHKIPLAEQKEKFHASHTIMKPSKPDYKIESNGDVYDELSSLMQLQQTQNLLSTKERPELDPILSAVINEDVMKSIEAKRAIEQQQLNAMSIAPSADATAADDEETTEIQQNILTTTAKTSLDFEEDETNVGFHDKQINLIVAGSENNQKSRIQIKKGPNGMDYEYEYVYYYYDDDEALGAGGGSIKKQQQQHQQEAESTLVSETSKHGGAAQPLERGKSRYTNIERSTTSAPDNALVSGKARGRSNTAATNASIDVDDVRLPVMTRFPSRGSANSNINDDQLLENSASNEKSKKISVKHPSLELVDSETFNTEEKQIKGSPRNSNSDKTTPAVLALQEIEAVTKQKPKNDEKISEELEQTTPLMEKAALDLYAILANENNEMDMTTYMDKLELTTIIPTESDDDNIMTTIENDDQTVTPTTPTSTTTTIEPSTTTTTTKTTTTTTPTTTTTQATTTSLFGAGRRGLGTVGRNRFRLKSGVTDAPTASTTEALVAPSENLSSGGQKGRNRFQRPSFGNRKSVTSAPAESSPDLGEKNIIVKETEKRVETSNPLRSRTRNRFNLRGASTMSTEAPADSEQDKKNEVIQVSSTTPRSPRGRPTLNIRGRSRPGVRLTTKAPSKTDNEEEANPDASNAEEEDKTILQSNNLQTRPSRFNLNRVGASGGTASNNRLLPRSRLSTLRSTSTTTPVSVEASDEASLEAASENNAESETTTTTSQSGLGGLNKIKSRPRLVVPSKTENKPKASSPVVAPRKPNPLLARRKPILGLTTTESSAAVAEEDVLSESQDSSKSDPDTIPSTTDEIKAEDSTEIPETTTKQVRGLGLLTQRRRLPIRKPGTQL